MSTALILVNTLDQYVPSASKPWNAARVQHLYQSLGFGGSPAQIQQGLAMQPAELVDLLIDNILNLPEPEVPYWGNWLDDDYPDDNPDLYFQVKREFNSRWQREMATEGMRAKLALFWHNHFVAEEEVYYYNSFMWSYYELIHRHVLGNFRDFVEAMGKNPAMLIYLNGAINVAGQPNENYARELMELFTMGESNGYTQNDIVEVARALTGWRVYYDGNNTAYFNPNLHDDGNKTIFGLTGTWSYNHVHDLIFNLRKDQVAQYISSKIYRHFVYDKPDELIISGLAQTFKDNNWELAPVFRQLFKSEHFFEDRFMNARIKSPTECLLGLFPMCGMSYPDDFTEEAMDYVGYASYELGQDVFNPVDVAGWPGHHSWLNENTLTSRWNFLGGILFYYFGNSDNARTKLRQLAINLTNVEERDPEVVTRAIVGHFLKRDLEPRLLETALQYFKGEIPENYFEQGLWNLYYNEVPDQVINLLYYISKLPEWQVA